MIKISLRRKQKKSQTLAETVVVGMVFVVALLVMSKYVKHALRGKWKSTADSGFGQPFDPKESVFKTVYQKSGDTENVILMEKEVIEETDKIKGKYYDPRTTNEVWYHTSYQAAGNQQVKDIDGNLIINSTTSRPLIEVNSEKSELAWKNFGE